MIEYELIRSNRKSVSLSITKEMKVRIRAPRKMTIEYIENFINKHMDWIENHKEITQKRLESNLYKIFSEEEKKEMKEKAKEVIPERVDYYSKIMGVKPNGIKITSATTRWGSCSMENNLCFSFRLMQYPIEFIDYIVVHELAHIRVKNHGAPFYKEVEKYMPDHKERAKLI